jgi:hypothetical protein
MAYEKPSPNRARDREIWLMKHEYRLTQKEIARHYGISVSRVRVVLSREPYRQRQDAVKSPVDFQPNGTPRLTVGFKTYSWTPIQQEKEIRDERGQSMPEISHKELGAA